MYSPTTSISNRAIAPVDGFSSHKKDSLTSNGLMPGLDPILDSGLPAGLPDTSISEHLVAATIHASYSVERSFDIPELIPSVAFLATQTTFSPVRAAPDTPPIPRRDLLSGQSHTGTLVGRFDTDALTQAIAKAQKENSGDATPLAEASVLKARTKAEAMVAGESYLAEMSTLKSTVRRTEQLSAAGALTQSTQILYGTGTLGADVFRYTPGSSNAVVSGNGNVHYGNGYRDMIDLSSISYRSVRFNLTHSQGGGVAFNAGNGIRVFDAIQFLNGTKLLFEGIDRVRFADGILDLTVNPNDPYFSHQWNLHMMGVHNAWRFTTGSQRDVLIGVQDTGLGVDNYGRFHPDLGHTLFYRNNVADDFFRNVPGAGYGFKRDSHGTPVQGIIAARTNNGSGMSGINWNSSVFHIDVLDNNPGDMSLAQATQNMINYANQQGQRLVINMSLGGGGIDPAFERLVATNQNNALFVVAAGNSNQPTLSDPASLAARYNNVIAVGASWGTRDVNGNMRNPGTRISYPNWWGSNYGEGLTVMGPSEVIAPTAQRTPWGVQFGYTGTFNGTSAAAPNVAGVASLVWSANARLSATQVKAILSRTAYDLGPRGYDREYGHGFVNADAAVRQALALRQN